MRCFLLALLLLLTSLQGSASGAILTGADMGAGPHVKVFPSAGGAAVENVFAYDPMFTGGVRVAAGDVTGDGVADLVTGAGPGAGPHVKVFDGQSGDEVRSFFATTPTFSGGVFVASGDVDDDGFADIVAGTDSGVLSEVHVFTGAGPSLLLSFAPYGTAFTGGVRVATGDINGDGAVEIITGAGPGGGPHVKVFSGSTGVETASFLAYDATFSGGVYVASGDVNGDGFDDIVTGAGGGLGGHVKVFDGQTGAEVHSFFAYGDSFMGGVRVAAGDVNGDGLADIITGAGPGGGPHVKVFHGQSGVELQSYFAYAPDFDGGIFVGYSPDVAVPEPGTLLLVGLAVGGMIARRAARGLNAARE